MYQKKKPRDYKSLWIISMFILAIGIVLTINLAIIRPVGYVLLGVGGFGLVWSLTNMDKWKDKNEGGDQKRFN